ncbi:ubiquitin carboxyl-terminal hydrolase 16-like isoform X2 [Pecten maximus]|uniref:ubiquitin carboxyl-terminal hydrolase 16-like isoform X2 n=1 Tax=Pecten maximus TaxID=6579 RepID=UPI001457F579|nr:ubiquitin carboxyl-terminal hydrolase 16-like isoform X2 [Pecten maximus]
MYWMWIVFGCVGGIIIFLVVVFCLYTYKKSRNKKKRDVEHFDDVENGNAPKRLRSVRNTILDFTEEPKGLPNVGETCYMNSMVQCLAWSPCLRSQLADQIRKQKFSYRENRVAKSLLTVLEAYHDDDDDETDDCFGWCYNDKRKSFREQMITFLDAISRRNDRFGSGEQEDTFEFYNVLISSLQEEALENIPRSNGDDTYDEHVMRHCSASRLFFGKFITSYYHQECGHVDVVPQSFTSLSIPAVTNSEFKSNSEEIHEVDNTNRNRLFDKPQNDSSIVQGTPKNEETEMPEDGNSDPDFGILGDNARAHRTNTIDVKPLPTFGGDKLRELSLDKTQRSRNMEETGVETGLRKLTETETRMASEISCRICEKTERDATAGFMYQKLQMISLPPVLVLQINRFEQRGYELFKVNERVTFPKSLDMARFCSVAMKVSGAGGKLTPGESYSLFGVVNHRGSIKGGHYFAYIKTSHRNAKNIQNQLQHQWYDPERITSSIRTELEKLLDPVKDEGSSTDTQSSVHSQERDQFPVADHQQKDEIWFSVSDSYVKKINEDIVMQSAEAYILMYERM